MADAEETRWLNRNSVRKLLTSIAVHVATITTRRTRTIERKSDGPHGVA